MIDCKAIYQLELKGNLDTINFMVTTIQNHQQQRQQQNNTTPLRILEVGCGRGVISLAIYQKLMQLNQLPPLFYSCDPDTQSIEQAKLIQQSLPFNFESLKFLNQSFLDLDLNQLEVECFDVLIFTKSFHHVQPLAKAAQFSRDILAKDGLFIAEELSFYPISDPSMLYLLETFDQFATHFPQYLVPHNRFLNIYKQYLQFQNQQITLNELRQVWINTFANHHYMHQLTKVEVLQALNQAFLNHPEGWKLEQVKGDLTYTNLGSILMDRTKWIYSEKLANLFDQLLLKEKQMLENNQLEQVGYYLVIHK